MKYSVEKSIRVGFILVCGLTIWIAAAAYLNIRRAQEALNWSRHSREVLNQIETTLSAMQDIETGTRGYLLTREERYLEPYRKANSRIMADVAHLRDLTADNPVQQGYVRKLQTAVEQKVLIANTLIISRRNGNPPPALARQELESGEQSMGQIRAVLANLDREEQDLHIRRRNAFYHATSKSLWTLGLLVGVMFVVYVILYSLLERHLGGRRRAERDLRDANLRLSDGIQELEGRSREIVLMSEMTSLLQSAVAPEAEI